MLKSKSRLSVGISNVGKEIQNEREGGMQFHIAATIFPMIEGEEFDALVDDIRANGQRETIKLLDGAILDGRNRYRACLIAKRPPRYQTIETDDPVGYAISMNKIRRQLTHAQSALVGARAKEVFEKLAKERQGKRNDLVEHVPPSEFGKARDMAGKAVGVSGKSIDHATKVLENGVPELVKAVEENRVAISTAAIISTKPAEVQRETLAQPNLKRGIRDRIADKAPTEKPKASNGKQTFKTEASTALQFAVMAISQLERIQLDDPKRDEAFCRVESWLLKARKL